MEYIGKARKGKQAITYENYGSEQLIAYINATGKSVGIHVAKDLIVWQVIHLSMIEKACNPLAQETSNKSDVYNLFSLGSSVTKSIQSSSAVRSPLRSEEILPKAKNTTIKSICWAKDCEYLAVALSNGEI